MNIKKVFYFIFFHIFFISCSKDTISGPVIEEESSEETVPVKPDNTAVKDCAFDLSAIKENETVLIDCNLNLEGKTINLPKGVTLQFEKGEIKNGTLNFTESGKIDGALLNSSLEIKGNVKLANTTFIFIPEKWENIAQGETNFDTALKNTTEFEKLLFFVQSLGGEIFEVDKFDAFFEVTTVTSTTSDQNYRPSKEAINLPSNFHLKMSDKTFLRMFTSAPTKTDGFVLAVRDVDNVTVTGGNIIGDVLKRKFETSNPGGTGSLLFGIHSGRNIKLNNIHFENGSAGAITIFSLGFPFNPDYKPSTNIEILNCVFKNNRRMSISITDGQQIVVKGSTFENIGQPIGGIDGGEVGYAINIEPFRERDANGSLIEYQRVSNVIVQDNKENNSRVGFLTIASSKNIIVENNIVETRIAFAFSSSVKVKNNTLTSPANIDSKFAIFAAGKSSQFNNDNEVYNNTIKGYGSAISITSERVKIYNNTISDVDVGLIISSSKEIEIFENTINSKNIGIISNLTIVDDIQIYDNTINTQGFHIKFSKINETNEAKNFQLTVKNNQFITQKPVSLFFANGVNLISNIINGGVEINNSSNINISSNTIIPDNRHGVSISGDNTNILLKSNKISIPTGNDRFKCINNNSNIPNDIIEENNTCN